MEIYEFFGFTLKEFVSECDGINDQLRCDLKGWGINGDTRPYTWEEL